MSSFRFARAQLVSLLVLFICCATAQNRFQSGPTGAKVLVPVGRQLNSVYQPSIENSRGPSKFIGVQDEINILRPYEFGFQMNDGNGTTQHRQEIRDGNGDVKGSYGYVDPFGIYRTVEYYTDVDGYHAKVSSNEPGLSNKNSANTIYVVENPPATASTDQPRIVLVPRRSIVRQH